MIQPQKPHYRAILVEDELRTRHMLEEMIEQKVTVADVELIASCGSIREALPIFKSLRVRPDIVFLDINLPDGPVFDLLEAIKPVDFEIIFITAYDEYTRQACQYASIAYLNKPVSEEELNEAVQRAAEYRGRHIQERLSTMKQAATGSAGAVPERVVLSTQEEICFVDPDDIIRVEADGNYSRVVVKEGNAFRTVVLSQNIGKFEEMLPPVGFFKTHRAHIVNIAHVRRYLRNDSTLLMEDGGTVLVSRRRKNQLLDLLEGRVPH
ncbi:MAG: DNA-binding response regulator [Bacteroidetes bacterium]|nr:MAG: DNA-binding response regulator [Bacteroidota bacterium]